MSASENKYITVVRLKNPFNVKNFDKDLVVWESNKTVVDYLPPLGVVELDKEPEITFVVSINGKVVKEEDYSVTYLNAEDSIIICPVPGKGGKSIFKLIALIAVAIIAPQIGGMIASSMGVEGGIYALGNAVTVGELIGTAVAFVGKALVSAMFAPSQAAPPSASLDSSPSYGVDGPKNVSGEGVVVPVVYGQFRCAGNLVNAYVENATVDKIETQYVYMQYCVSEGPISGISDLKFNDQVYSNFKDVTYEVRNGLASQPVVGWFNDTFAPRTISQKMTNSWSMFTTLDAVDKLRFDVVFPNGLFTINTTSGSTENRTTELQIQYRLQGSATWIGMGDSTVVDHYERRFNINGVAYLTVPSGYYDGKVLNGSTGTFYIGFGVKQYSDNCLYKKASNNIGFGTTSYVVAGSATDVAIYKTVLGVSRASRTPVRVSYSTPLLAQGIYETRYMRTNAESTSDNVIEVCYMNEINEIVVDDVQYNNTALLAVRVKLSDQLNGIPKVSYLVSGVQIRVWNTTSKVWATESSDNPAWVILDILTNTRYGAGVADSRIDMDMFKEWAAHCDTYNLTFNGIFDTSLNLWTALQYVLRAGHAQIVIVGTRITVAIDRIDSPVMLFSVANMIEGSFAVNWLPMSDRANEIEVNYFDYADDYKQRAIKLYDKAAVDAGIPVKTSTVTLYGVTDAQRASSEALLMLNMNRYITQTVQFDASVEAIGCTIGDLIYVQHDMPQWGYAGRLEANNTASVLHLDRPMDVVAGKIYRALVLHDFLPRAAGIVTNVIGSSVTLSGYTGVTNVKRLQILSGSAVLLDREVSSVFGSSSTFGVILHDATGITTGMSYKLVDTDVLEERDIVNPGSGSYSVITLQSPMSAIPPQFANFMFGESTKVNKPFRVRSISGTGDYVRTISGVEYNASVYDYDDTTNYATPNYSSLDTHIKNVTITEVTEELYRLGSSFGVHATIHYTSTQESYKTSKVFLSRNGGAYIEVGNGYEAVTVIAADKEVLAFKVVAIDVLGVQAPLSSAPTLEYTVIGKLAPPADVQGFSYLIRTDDLQLSWLQNQDMDIAGYELRKGASWDAGVTVFSGLALTATDKINAAGSFFYHVRAYDTSGIFSSHVSTQSITFVEPRSVTSFIVVQSSGRVDMRWDANPETNITNYEIREGATWLSSSLVGTTKSTTYSIPAGGGSRMFWIKAIISPGIYSASASFFGTDVATSDNRNILLTFDNTALGFPGSKRNAVAYGYGVQFLGGTNSSEYSFTADLGSTYHASNTLYTAFSAVQVSTLTWLSSTWAWTSTAADVPWATPVDLNSVAINFQIAPNSASSALDIDGWRLDGSLNGVSSSVATQSLGVSYTANGRYSSGAYVSQLTSVSWNVSMTSAFKYVFWVRPSTLNAVRFMTLSNASEELAIGYASGSFYVKDNKPQTVSVPFTFVANDLICIAIVQTATARKLFVSDFSGSNVVTATQPFTPSSNLYTKLRLY